MGETLSQWANETVTDEYGFPESRFGAYGTSSTNFATETHHSSVPLWLRNPRIFVNTSRADWETELVNTLRHEYGHIYADTPYEDEADQYKRSCQPDLE